MYLQNIPAYTYKITIIDTGQFYYGYRRAHIKANRLPEDDFLIKYFSCSDIVKHVIKMHGIKAIKGEILFKDFNWKNAYWKEQELIEQSYGNSLLLNQYYHSPTKGLKIFTATPTGTAKMLKTRLKNKTQKTKKYIKKQQLTHNKDYMVMDPSGNVYQISGLKAHCEKYQLHHSAMARVGQGKKPHHKLWRCLSLTLTMDPIEIERFKNLPPAQIAERPKLKKVTCQYCGKVGAVGNMKPYHFDNCKKKPIS